jgi:hypothetical protein
MQDFSQMSNRVLEKVAHTLDWDLQRDVEEDFTD